MKRGCRCVYCNGEVRKFVDFYQCSNGCGAVFDLEDYEDEE